MIQYLYRSFIELTNNKWTSLAIKKFSQSSMSRFLIPSFAKVYKVNVDEMEKDLSQYSSLHDFFIRQLKKDARTIHSDQSSVVSPVDSILEDMGTISNELMMIVKGKKYSIVEMLGKMDRAEKYMGGTYMIFYLSPGHYHRIHSPFTGTIIDHWTLGNFSYPVNRLGIKYGKKTLSKNFRKITEVKLFSGHAAIVKVGAMYVNSIKMTIHDTEITKGEEMAYFSFGSTVILLFEKDLFEPLDELQTPMPIKVGQIIGYLKDEDCSMSKVENRENL